jgi:hypothetical protein
VLRAGLEPATCRLGVDNRNHPARSREVRRGLEMRSGRGVEPQRRTFVQPPAPDNRAAPARDDLAWSRPARGRTRTSEVGARRAAVYTTGLRKRTTRIERASPEWRSGALPSELRPRDTPGWNRTSGLCRRRTALSPLSYGRTEPGFARREPSAAERGQRRESLPFLARRSRCRAGGDSIRIRPRRARCRERRERSAEPGFARREPSAARDGRSLRQDSNPHLGRTKGACLPLTLRRLAERGDRRLSSREGSRRGSARVIPHARRAHRSPRPRRGA